MLGDKEAQAFIDENQGLIQQAIARQKKKCHEGHLLVLCEAKQEEPYGGARFTCDSCFVTYLQRKEWYQCGDGCSEDMCEKCYED